MSICPDLVYILTWVLRWRPRWCWWRTLSEMMWFTVWLLWFHQQINIFVHDLFHFILRSRYFSFVTESLKTKKKHLIHFIFPHQKQPFPEKNPISVLSRRSTNGIIELDLTLQACIHMRQLRSGHCYHKWAVKIITDVEPADSLSNKVSQTRK